MQIFFVGFYGGVFIFRRGETHLRSPCRAKSLSGMQLNRHYSRRACLTLSKIGISAIIAYFDSLRLYLFNGFNPVKTQTFLAEAGYVGLVIK
jgi:hypothetical protein